MNNTKIGLTNNQLKIIAMVSMFLDHAGLVLFPGAAIFRIIGRLAFPIFAYMIAEGCRYTKNRNAYFWKIAILALGCQIVYAVVERSFYQSVLVTFSLSILTVFSIDKFLKNRSARTCICMVCTITAVLFLTVVVPHIFREYGFEIDYGFLGVLLPVAVYFGKNRYSKLLLTALVLILMGFSFGGLQWYGLLAIPLLLLYNQRRGKLNMKYVFYIFYPVHLVAIYLIGMLLA